MQIGEELISAESLEDFWRRYEAGESGAERCGEAARVIQGSKS